MLKKLARWQPVQNIYLRFKFRRNITMYKLKKYLRRVNFQFPNLSILQIFEFLNNFWGNFEKILVNFCKYRSERRWKVKFMRNYGCRTQKYLHNWVKCPVKYLNEGESIWQSVEQDTQILIFIISSFLTVAPFSTNFMTKLSIKISSRIFCRKFHRKRIEISEWNKFSYCMCQT